MKNQFIYHNIKKYKFKKINLLIPESIISTEDNTYNLIYINNNKIKSKKNIRKNTLIKKP